MNPVALAIEGLTVTFDGFRAVDDLNFYVDKNELRVVIGPNGAGKTTLLDLICGKTKASAGSIMFHDRELTTLTEHDIVRVGIGRKFQTPSIYESLTIHENLELSCPRNRGVFGALFRGLTPEYTRRITEVAEQIGLGAQLHEIAGPLSHGQKQWLEIGMLLMQEPELLLLDEPVAGMSPREREQTAALLKQIAVNRAMIVIEHDMQFVEAIAHRVTVLHQGKILSEGSMDTVKHDPHVVEVYLGH
jgi:urea transport system ATP-binding protein